MSERDDFAEELRGDVDEPTIELRRPASNMAGKLPMVVAALSILGNVATVFWWGGRLDQRVTSNERTDEKRDERLHQITVDNARQDSFIAASNVQYSEIMRRLDAIDRKLDAR